MGYESIMLMIGAGVLAYLYVHEDKKQIFFRTLYVYMSLTFITGALILNYNLATTSCITTTATVCTYTYSNTLVNLAWGYIPMTILTVAFILFFAYRIVHESTLFLSDEVGRGFGGLKKQQ